ncbi:MAG: hypothetical protein WDO14_11715 [Bacteroidota bacterium]
MGSELLIKAIACLLIVFGASGIIAGLMGFFGSPWLLTVFGSLFLLSGYGFITRDLDEIK